MIIKAIIWGFVLVSSAAYATDETPVAAPAKTGRALLQLPVNSIPDGSGRWDWELLETKDGRVQFDISGLSPSQNFIGAWVTSENKDEIRSYYEIKFDRNEGKPSGNDIIYIGTASFKHASQAIKSGLTAMPAAYAMEMSETGTKGASSHTAPLPKAAPEDKFDAEFLKHILIDKPNPNCASDLPIPVAFLPLPDWYAQYPDKPLQTDTRGRQWKIRVPSQFISADTPGNFNNRFVRVTYNDETNMSIIEIEVISQTGTLKSLRSDEPDGPVRNLFKIETTAVGFWGIFFTGIKACDLEMVPSCLDQSLYTLYTRDGEGGYLTAGTGLVLVQVYFDEYQKKYFPNLSSRIQNRRWKNTLHPGSDGDAAGTIKVDLQTL